MTAYIQNFFDTDMVFQITDDQEKAKVVQVSKEQFQAIKNRVFDVIVKEQPDYATAHEESFDQLATVLPQVAQYGPAWGQILVMNSNLREKDKTLKVLEDMSKSSPPPPKMSVAVNWSELDKVEKAAFAAKMDMPDLAQYEQTQGRGPARDDKAQLEIVKTQITQGVKSGIENSKLQFQEQNALAQHQLALRELNDAREAQLQAQTTEQGADSGSTEA